MSPKRKMLVGAILLVLCSFVCRTTSADSIMPGAACQPRQGNQQQFLVHGVQGTGNNLGDRGNPVVEVVCPLVRSSIKVNSTLRVKVFVVRTGNTPAGSPLSCALNVRTPQGGGAATPNKQFLGVGESTLDFEAPAKSNDYCVVHCSLPFEGAIRSIILEP